MANIRTAREWASVIRDMLLTESDNREDYGHHAVEVEDRGENEAVIRITEYTCMEDQGPSDMELIIRPRE